MHPLQAAEDAAPRFFEYVPIGQLTHTLLLDAPAVEENVPAAQFTQAPEEAAPVKLEYVPAMQFRHLLAAPAPTVAE